MWQTGQLTHRQIVQKSGFNLFGCEPASWRFKGFVKEKQDTQDTKE